MPRACTVCQHAERDAIDTALAGGETHTSVAARVGLPRRSVSRHAAAHLPRTVAKAAGAREVSRADALLTTALDLEDATRGLLAGAVGDGDRGVAIAAVRAAGDPGGARVYRSRRRTA